MDLLAQKNHSKKSTLLAMHQGKSCDAQCERRPEGLKYKTYAVMTSISLHDGVTLKNRTILGMTKLTFLLG